MSRSFLIAMLFFLISQAASGLSLANGIVLLGIEVDLGMEATFFDEDNKEYLPGDTEPEWDEFIDENSLLGIGRLKGMAMITAFPFLLEIAGGIDIWNMDLLLERAYFSVMGNRLFFTAGKQEAIWGTGVLYYPLYFKNLMNTNQGFQTRDFDIPEHWIAELRFESMSQQLTLRGIVEKSAVESAEIPEWFYIQLYQQIYFPALTLSWQLPYERDIDEEENIFIPGADFSYVFKNNSTLFGGFSSRFSLDGQIFEPRASLGFSWLLENAFISVEASFDEWFEIGFFANYSLPGSPFSANLTLKADPIGLGFMGVAAVIFSDDYWDLELGGVYMEGTERTYYGNSPITAKVFAKATFSL